MKLNGDTVLITGGSDGIGYALASMLAADNTVIICGRDEARLKRARQRIGEVHTEVCDVTDAAQRQAMVQRLLEMYPQLNVLINNAGGKQPTDLLSDQGLHHAMARDLALNFEAPVAFSIDLLPHLVSRPRAAIINITTGLVHLPKVEQVFYCAAKAALHSYTRSLRWELRASRVRVHEVLLPLVNTNFHQGELPETIRAIGPEEAARQALKGIRRGKAEVYVGKAALAPWFSLFAPQTGMGIMNR